MLDGQWRPYNNTGIKMEYEMQTVIHETPWVKTLIGLSKQHDPAVSYGDEIRTTLNPVWEAVHENQVAVTGINHVVYSADGAIFCGLECKGEPPVIPGLVQRRIEFPRYAYYCHTGLYERIPQAYETMQAELERLGLHTMAPSMEIYGHWNDDPEQLVTEILQSIA
jgi:effector-binding domain-containing protein